MEILAQLTVNSLIAGSLYALLAMSFNLVFGATKFFNFCHGSMSIIAGYVAWRIMQLFDVPPLFGILVGISASALAGYLLQKIVYEPLIHRHASTMTLLVSSIGAMTLIEAFVYYFFGSSLKVIKVGDFASINFSFFGAGFTMLHIIMIMTSFFIALILICILKKTDFGMTVAALTDDREVAAIVGIKTEKLTLILAMLGAMIAGSAGILAGIDVGLTPTLGMILLLKGVIAAIVGGLGSVHGGLLGGLFLGFAENFGIWPIGGEWKDAIAFGILILFLFVHPFIRHSRV